MEKLVIDRFEENFAVCENENGEWENIPRDELPENANEGEHILRNELGSEIDEEATKVAQERIEKKMKRLFGKNKKQRNE